MRATSCNRCGWPIEDQVFDKYTVGVALEILAASPRPAVLLTAAEVNKRSIRDAVSGTDRHCGHVDARRPVIAVPRGTRWVIIDGNHRAAKQLQRNRPVRAYLLTAAEAHRVRTEE